MISIIRSVCYWIDVGTVGDWGAEVSAAEWSSARRRLKRGATGSGDAMDRLALGHFECLFECSQFGRGEQQASAERRARCDLTLLQVTPDR